MNKQHQKAKEHLHKIIKIYKNLKSKKSKNIILEIMKDDLKKEIIFFFRYRFCIDYMLENHIDGWQYKL